MHTSEFDEIITFPVGNAKFPPDASQQKVIKAINNTVVSAGAGSGKTEVLATRFAYLLMTDPDLHVRNILAITFTKKAAAEIYARVFKKLNDYKNTLSDPKYNRKYIGEGKPVDLAKRALDEFSDARIQTLDSYSNDVVKLAVARYGIKPDFSGGEPASEINLMAKNFVIRNLENLDFQDAYKTFSQVGKLEQFAKDYFSTPILECTSIATEANWFSKNLPLQSKKITDAWNEAMKPSDETFSPLAIKNNAAIIFENMKAEDKKKPSYKNVPKILNASDSIFVTIDEAISENNAEKILEEITPFIEWLEIEKPAGNSNVGKALKLLKFDKDDLFNPYGKFSACYSFIKNYRATAQMYKMMDMFLEEVNAKKKKDGQLSFKDISELALRVLHEQSDILKQQQSLIKKIMIDEFQDNNAKNKELLELLAGESKEKLFFVGDEKQSIYKFRGADVSVFNGLKNSLEGKDGEKVLYEMNNNYRSDSELLKAFNVMFGDDKNRRPTQIPEAAPDQFYDMPALFYFENYLAVPEYEAMYLEHNFATKPGKEKQPDGTPKDEVAPIELSESNIKIHACILNSGKNQDDENKFSDFKKTNKILNESETAAFFIAKKIKELVDGGMSFSEIAILDSSRTHRGHLQKFLTMEGIPYSVDVQKNIFSEGIVNDFYNFLRICIYPNDTNAFIAFLTSPFVCMSQIGAENVMAIIFDRNEKIIVEDDGNEFEITKNFEAFSDDFDSELFDLDESDKEKYERAKEFYKTEKLAILSSSITKTIEHLWYNTGYFFETELNANTKIYGEQFDLLYQVAIDAENQGKNIEWFIDQLAITKQAENSFSPDENADLETDDVHYPLEKQEAVTIMTIHQSKGLEFGTVFVTGIFDNPKIDKSEATFFDEGTEEATGVSLQANDGSYNYFYLEHLEDSKNKSLAEQKRLIYVAITRAKNEVFLVGDLAESDDLKLQTPKTKVPYYKPNAPCSLMHKILRYYYSGEKGLYQDNDYDDGVLEKMSEIVPAEKPYYNATTKAPFDFIKINPVSAKARATKQKSTPEQRAALKEKLESLFNKKEKELLTLPEKELRKTATPSSLEIFGTGLKEIEKTPNPDYAKLNDFFTSDDATISDVAGDENSPIEETAAKSEFTRGTFGTMAHSYLEHWVKTGKFDDAENPATFDSTVAKSLAENFTAEKHATLSKICALMTKNFAESTLGKKVAEAKAAGRIVKAENKFKLFQGETLFTGSIDLFFENEDGTFTLVDYKTNQKIRPEKYIDQQKCYKSAIEKIYGRNVAKCFLYFLRFDCEIEIG